MTKKILFIIMASIFLPVCAVEIDKKELLSQLDELKTKGLNALKMGPSLKMFVDEKLRAQQINPQHSELFKQLERRLKGLTSMLQERVIAPIDNLSKTIKKTAGKSELIDLAFRVKKLQRELDPHAETLTWLKRYANETLVDAADILTHEAKTKTIFSTIAPDYELDDLGKKDFLEQVLTEQMGVFRGELKATRTASGYTLEEVEPQ